MRAQRRSTRHPATVLSMRWSDPDGTTTIAAMRLVRLKELRRQKRWTQEDLSARCKLDRTFISRLENDDVGWSRESLILLADALGVEAWTLLGYDAPPTHDLPKAVRDGMRVLATLSPEAATAALAAINAVAELDRNRVKSEGGQT